jgi:drug/metabolite transporter (DMT)-like permease
MSAFTMSFLRVLPAAIILIAVTTAMRLSLAPLMQHWHKFLLLAAINNYLPFLLLIYGQHQVTGGIAAIFNATSPLFAAFLAHAMTHDDKLSANKVAGILAGIAGVGVLAWHDLWSGSEAGLLATLAMLGAAFSYALAGVFGRSFRGTPPFVIATGQMVGALVLSVPLLVLVAEPWNHPAPSTAALLATLATGVFGSALASMFYFTILKRAGATNALLVTLLLPLTPITLGALFLGQTLKSTDIAGGLLIALALIVIDGRAFRLGGRRR